MNLVATAKFDERGNRFWAVLRGGSFFAIPDDQCDDLEDGQEIYISIATGYEYCNLVRQQIA